MNLRLEQKVIVVTGGSKGIGYGSGENELDDQAFKNAFMVTADEIPEFDGNTLKGTLLVV